jgi:hypothetical protein
MLQIIDNNSMEFGFDEILVSFNPKIAEDMEKELVNWEHDFKLYMEEVESGND